MTGTFPGWMFRHRITVEPYLGSSAYGPRFGPAAEVRCWLEETTRLVRSPAGEEVVSSTTACAPLDTDCPARSRITLPDGRTTTVIAALRHNGKGLPTPDHLEVQLV